MGQINGHVTDPKGAAIENAAVFVRAYGKAPGKVELVVHTDRNGDFTLKLPQDTYDVIVSSPGFKSILQTIGIRTGKRSDSRWILSVEDCDLPGVNCDTFQ